MEQSQIHQTPAFIKPQHSSNPSIQKLVTLTTTKFLMFLNDQQWPPRLFLYEKQDLRQAAKWSMTDLENQCTKWKCTPASNHRWSLINAIYNHLNNIIVLGTYIILQANNIQASIVSILTIVDSRQVH